MLKLEKIVMKQLKHQNAKQNEKPVLTIGLRITQRNIELGRKS